MVVLEEWSVDEAGAYVCYADIEVADVSQLGERLEVGSLEGLGGRVGGRGAESHSAGDRGDSGDMSMPLGCEEAEGLADHAGEAEGVGLDSLHLDSLVERAVLVAYAGGVEEEIHAAEVVDEGAEVGGGICGCHVDATGDDWGGERLGEFVEEFDTSGGDGEGVACGGEEGCDFAADAGRGTDDDGAEVVDCIIHI